MWKKRAAAGLLALLLAFLQGFLFQAVTLQAASGTVYSCTINRCYAHPVTGEIEDPGGKASYTTGQGMVEGAVYSSGIMEVTDSGGYYLTFRMSLIDYTSSHSFSVQNVGESGWSAVTPTVTANGSDSNGTTSDLCIQVPSENCIVRGSMNVTPMGRDVIFYFYPNNYTEGNSVGMATAIVTESPGSEAEEDNTSQAEEDNTGQAEEDNTSQAEEDNTGQAEEDNTGQAEEDNTGQAGAETSNQMANSIGQAAAPADNSEPDPGLSNAQGLSLSTATEVQGETGSSPSGTGMGTVDLIVAITASITLSGLILMAAAAAIVCYFRKNWRRWGGYGSEDYDDEDE